MKPAAKKETILSRIFMLANKVQMLGDSIDSTTTIKQVQLMETVQSYELELPTVSQLAESVGSSRQNVKKMAGLLEKQGFMALSKDEKDARMIRVMLTEKGTVYLASRKSLNKTFHNQIFDGFDEKQLKSLMRLLSKLSKNASAMNPEPESENFT